MMLLSMAFTPPDYGELSQIIKGGETMTVEFNVVDVEGLPVAVSKFLVRRSLLAPRVDAT